MGADVSLRIETDRDTHGQFLQAKGEIVRRTPGRVGNSRALRILAKVYLELARQDPGTLDRILQRIALDEKGFR
jgi:hypothetical protein